MSNVTYKATIEVAIPCLVCCRNCDCQFVYESRYSGQGEADTLFSGSEQHTRKKAEKKARDDLNEMLSNFDLYEPVPCPKCFHYQPYMFPQVGYGRYDNLGCVTFAFQFLGFLVFVGAIIYGLITGFPLLAYILGVGGAAGLLFGWMLNRRRERLVAVYNPNEEMPLAERQKIADARAFLLAEYDAEQADRAGEEYAHYRTTNPGSREPLVVAWWLPSAVFANGGTITIAIQRGPRFTANVPDTASLGDVIDTRAVGAGGTPLQLRLLEMRVHPDELRLD